MSLDELVQPLGYPTYNAYLASDHWLAFTFAVRARKCFCCGATGCELHVHHVTYERIGQELQSDVVTLCRQCHVDVHFMHDSGIALDHCHLLLKAEITKNRRDSRGNQGRP